MRITVAIAAVFGALIALLGVYELGVDFKKRNLYEPTSCTVLSRSVVEEEPTEEYSRRYGQGVKHYPVRVSVRFRYRVAGVDFVGEEDRFFENGEAAIQAHYDAHPPESTHGCWYDPDRPQSRAILTRNVSSFGPLMMLGVGLAVTAGFGFVFRMLGARSHAERR